jgi:hypothetical protein
MELKGQAANKIPKEKKVKMEETLQRMQDVRVQDSSNLRDRLTARLTKLLSEQERGSTEILRLEKQLLKIEGAIILIKEVLAPVVLEPKKE